MSYFSAPPTFLLPFLWDNDRMGLYDHTSYLCPILTPTELCLALKMFKKHRVSCHNVFLQGKRKPTTCLTLQEEHKSNLRPFFSILGWWDPNVEISFKSSSLKKGWNFKLVFNQNLLTYGISKFVSLSIRRLRELNLH